LLLHIRTTTSSTVSQHFGVKTILSKYSGTSKQGDSEKQPDSLQQPKQKD